LCAGVGVHTGAHARAALKPAPADSGIVFVRTDLAGDNVIRAHADNVATTRLGTTLSNGVGADIATVEHLLAACAGLGIDNLLVEIDGPEAPILDGSAAPFADLLLQAGLRPQNAVRRHIEVLRPVEVRLGAKHAVLEPCAQAEIDVTIRYAAGPIGVQRRHLQLSPESFLAEIAHARTYGFMADVDRLRALGLGRGASLENTVVLDAGKVVNKEGLRFADEFVRHKVLDAIGDLALAGAPIRGRYVADQPGHELNVRLVQALLADRAAWRWAEGAPEPALAAAG
jgi:UDP-3-O-[3-hydroxymyristoyl] N-acetylglucosamine deacetylase